jgi:hypothetical protein
MKPEIVTGATGEGNSQTLTACEALGERGTS